AYRPDDRRLRQFHRAAAVGPPLVSGSLRAERERARVTARTRAVGAEAVVTARGIPAPASYQSRVYWEERARRFATEGNALAAVCSYGMPAFYNRVIH